MPRVPTVPAELRAGPFPRELAALLGVTRRQLAGPAYRRLYDSIYVWRGCDVTPDLLIAAAALVLPKGGAFSGRTAAYLHRDGLGVPPSVEVTVPRADPCTTRPGLTVRRALLPPEDIVEVKGVDATSPLRTAFDLARLEPRREAVAYLDAMLHWHLVSADALREFIAAHPRWRGVRLAADRLKHSHPGAESPMETWLRLILVDEGLPTPVVNEPLHDEAGSFLCRPDLRIEHVLIEFDGDGHRNREVFVNDLQRQNRIVNAGYVVLRFTSADLRRPDLIADQVRRALRSRRSWS